jgi:mannosyltransferase
MPLQGANTEATAATELTPAIELGGVRHVLRAHADVVALVIITAVAAAVRFATLGMQGLDHDEAVTAAGVLQPTLSGTLAAVAHLERTPPLYYILEWIWTKPLTFANGSVDLRFLSAIFGTLTVPAAFLAARELSSRRAGVITAALVALNPFLVWYSQEARAYALLVLFIALGLYVFARALRNPTPGRLGIWALVSILGLCTHYFAAFTVAPEAAWLLWSIRPRRRPLAAVAAVGVAAGALLPLAVSQQGSKATDWFSSSPLLTRAWQIPVHFASTVKPEIPFRQAWVTELQIAAGAFVLILLLAGAVILARRGDSRAQRGALLVSTLAGASFLIPVLLAAAGRDFVDARNLIGSLVLLLVAAGIVFGAARPPVVGVIATAAMCAVFAGLLIKANSTRAMERPDWRVDAASIGGSRTKRLVVVPRTAEPPLSYYLGAQRVEGVGRPVWVREIELFSTAPTSDGPSAPFRLVSERSVRHQMWVARYDSRRPVRVWLSPDRATRMIGQGAGALVTAPGGRGSAS